MSNVSEKKVGFIDIFLIGARKGINLWFNALLPGVVLGYSAIEVLKVTGILDIVGKLFTPIMAVFGLPGEAMMALLTSFMALSGGCAAAASLAANGILDAKQATIILPMILCIGSQVQFIGRVLAVADVPSNKYLINCAIGIICAVIAGLFMRIIA
ncbi:nucleoside recognition domain-containing protein [Proteiniborus sp. MB09-C3]|uniref:nucleoside recognition domain-containing protein n=1 Tax=Proteiniborus sp. MB09-C3 TaxID=3050072 RepID=UPI0025531574|nr:nucleoside recognition domain-containing protein [Proteiniborus sp. MB09-C3]WIV12153.1 nucleoside recognition domain-containing protein [Proteiniborus sp. MB09-C3]